ncbi:MAG: fibronectin type III domain-containing protein [Gammaproteobacteria bacterium]
MGGYATVGDVDAEYDGDIPVEQVGYVAQKLASAEVVLGAVAGDITARITAGKTTPDAVRLVLCNMVLRVLRNADGIRTQTAGPFSYTLDQQVASGRLYVSREDRRLMGMRPGASTVTLDDRALPHVVTSPVESGEVTVSPAVLGAPTGLAAGPVTASSVVLTWAGVTNAVSYLVQFRVAAEATDEFSVVTSVNGGTPTGSVTTITGLTAATGYQFRVAAVNYQGQVSNPSAAVTVTTP